MNLRTSVTLAALVLAVATCRYRDTFEVTMEAEATVTIHLNRELDTPTFNSAGAIMMYAPTWRAPSIWQKETLAGIESAQQELLREILQ